MILRLLIALAMLLPLSAFGQMVPRAAHLTLREASVFMLFDHAVRKEIKFTGGQAARFDDYRDKHTRAQTALFDMWKPDLDAALDAKQEKRLNDLEKQFASAVLVVLEEKQRKRLYELALQDLGPEAFVLPEIIQGLSLSERQTLEIKSLVDEMDRQIEEFEANLADRLAKIEEPGPSDRDARSRFQAEQMRVYTELEKQGASISKVRDLTYTKVIAQLNADQKKKWMEMQGEKFVRPVEPPRDSGGSL